MPWPVNRVPYFSRLRSLSRTQWGFSQSSSYPAAFLIKTLWPSSSRTCTAGISDLSLVYWASESRAALLLPMLACQSALVPSSENRREVGPAWKYTLAYLSFLGSLCSRRNFNTFREASSG